MSWLFWLFVLILLAGAAGRRPTVGLPRLRHAATRPQFQRRWLFGPRPEPRLGVIEQATVDSRRKLVLIRRDDVEHLIMTGGPVDVVIETGIQAAPRPSPPSRMPAEPSAARVHPQAAQLRPSRQRMKQAVFSASALLSSLAALAGCDAHRSLPAAGAGAGSPARRNRSARSACRPAPAQPAPPSAAARRYRRRRGAADGGDRGRREDDPALAELEEELGGLRVDVEKHPVQLRRHRRDAAPATRRRQIADREARARRPPRTRRPEAPAIAAERARLDGARRRARRRHQDRPS